jgi:hypothetical protein
MLEYWNNGMAPFGQINACGEKREAGGNNYLPYQIVLSHYSNIPSFHYSCLEYAEWLAGDSLLSTICRNSDT